MKDFSVVNMFMGLSIFVAASGIVFGLCISGCTDDNEAKRALEAHGFTKVTVNDRGAGWPSLHGCDEKDGVWYEATAENAAGKQAQLVVCCGGPGSFKGCTVRTK